MYSKIVILFIFFLYFWVTAKNNFQFRNEMLEKWNKIVHFVNYSNDIDWHEYKK